MFLSAVPAVLVTGPVASAATVPLGFSTGTHPNTRPNDLNDRNAYDESGFRFAVTNGGNHVDSDTSQGYLYWYDGPANRTTENPLLLTRTGGGAFNLTSLQVLSGSTGVVVSSSTLTVGQVAIVGNDGAGTLTATGGTLAAGSVWLARNAGSTGTVTVANATVTAGELDVGGNDAASGGTGTA